MTLSVLYRFVREDDGAVTVDWVALTAGVIAVAIATVYFIFGMGVEPQLQGMGRTLTSVALSPSPETPTWARQ